MINSKTACFGHRFIIYCKNKSPRNALWRGYNNAAVVPSVRASVSQSVRASRLILVNAIATKLLCTSSSNLADMFTMTRG